MTDCRHYPLFWRWHFFAAALVIPFVLWQSTTGTIYLWSEWWMDVSRPELRFVIPTDKPSTYADQVGAALALLPNMAVQDIFIPLDPGRSTTVTAIGSDGLAVPVFVDPDGARVLGQLTSAEWLPGLSRSLHRGWPFGEPGNWVLELGNCWAIVMLVSGLYLWWPRGRTFPEVLWPRLHMGSRIVIRDLHACVAVWFSAIFLFFLVSAMPWTHFWGGVILPKIQTALGQESPAGFSVGGALSSRMVQALPSLDALVEHARAEKVAGTLNVKLDAWDGAPWWMTNVRNPPGTDRYLIGDTESAEVIGSYTGADLPLIPAAVALGIHLHQGDFGPVNRWLNTALAVALIWLSMTGLLSWWRRRPKGRLGIPPDVCLRWPRVVAWSLAAMSVLLPLFGLSVLAIAGLDRVIRFATARKGVLP